jgi:outer membrane protein TolC
VEIALERNPDIIAAGRGIEAAQGRFWQGVSPPPPTLSVTYDYIPLGGSISQYGERFIEVNQSFDFPTTYALRGSSRNADIDVATADARSVALAVILQVKYAYHAVLAAEKKLALASENLAIAEDFAKKAAIRQNVGEGTNLESLTAKVQQTQARNAVEVAGNEIRLATGALNHALGRGKEQLAREFILSDSLVYLQYDFDLDSLIAQAHRSNPDLVSASSRLGAASANRAIAWSSLLPSFSISYSRQLQAEGLNFTGAAFGISLPLWFLFDNRGQIQEAIATHARTESELISKQNLVSLDVKNAWLEFKSVERQVQLHQTELLPQAEEVYRSAVTSYQVGEITYLEFLQAKQTVISVRSASIDALYNYNNAVARLEHAIGLPIKK